jgi:hypothetical protein
VQPASPLVRGGAPVPDALVRAAIGGSRPPPVMASDAFDAGGVGSGPRAHSTWQKNACAHTKLPASANDATRCADFNRVRMWCVHPLHTCEARRPKQG